MNNQQRDALRRLQDRIVEKADRCNIAGETRVSSDGPPNMTIDALRLYIFPGYESLLEGVLRELQSR